MPRKTMSNQEKVKIVLASSQENIIVTKFCIKHGIPRSTFYRWRKLVLTGLCVIMSANKRPSQDQGELVLTSSTIGVVSNREAHRWAVMQNIAARRGCSRPCS